MTTRIELIRGNRYVIQGEVFERNKVYEVDSESADYLLSQEDTSGVPYFRISREPSPEKEATGKAPEFQSKKKAASKKKAGSKKKMSIKSLRQQESDESEGDNEGEEGDEEGVEV